MSYTTRNFLWEAVASYIVNDYFTYIYNAAKATTRSESLTSAYQLKVELYIRGIKNVEQNYRTLCSDLHRYIMKSNRFNSLMYGEFVDRLVCSFTPTDYYNILDRNQKDEIFSSIINELIASIGSFCVKPSTLRKIIDEHDKSKHITQNMIYSEALNILSIKKENLTHSFIRNIGQVKESVPIEVVDRYIEQIHTITEENEKLKSIISDLENENASTIEKFENREYKFRKLIEYLKTNSIIVKEKEKEKEVSPPKSPVEAVLTKENLQKHLDNPDNKPTKISTQLRDESSEESAEIVTGTRVLDTTKSKSLDSGKVNISDNIEGLLLVDQISD